MIIFTSHVTPRALPVLVREGFSWGAAMFGWLWFLVQSAWVPGLLVLAGDAAATWAASTTGSLAPLAAAFLVQGVFGRDLVRWSLGLRGYVPGLPVAATTHDGALLRLLSERPALCDVAG
jgi:hypothetical protein